MNNLVDTINEHRLDLVVLTETWLRHDISHRLNNVAVAQSEFYASQGIVILGMRNITALQPFLPVLWSPALIIVKATCRNNGA